MRPGDTEKHHEQWDRTFRKLAGETLDADPWLQRWLGILEADRGVPILELGCGGGHDARFLTERGFPVVATDFSEEALKLTRRNAPGAEVKRVDMTLGLPFADTAFRVVVASLSLHYFPWQKTVEIANEVYRCLRPDGYLLARVNSTNDEHYAAAEKEEIEENFYLVAGMPKRLFDRKSVETLFADGWELVSANERTTKKYGEPKTLWEIAARKPKC